MFQPHCRRRVSDPAGGPLNVSRLAATCRRARVHDHRPARHAALLGVVSRRSSPRRPSGSSTTRPRATSSSSPTKATSSSTTPRPEWHRANTSMSLLDGVVPYGMGPGNHDQPTTLFNQYFPYTRYQGQPWYGGHYQNMNDNNFQLFSGGGMDFVIVHLDVLSAGGSRRRGPIRCSRRYPDRIGIMTTHGYLERVGAAHGAWLHEHAISLGRLAVPNPNLHFMLSGHVHDESRRSRCRQRPSGVPDAGRLSGPRQAAAKAGCGSCDSSRPRTRSTCRRTRRG